MQPYFFPYIGYFQLINYADTFIFYDDVNFIKKGWINRNRVLVNGEIKYITVPLSHASQNKKINQINISDKLYDKWKQKNLRTIYQSYCKAEFFKPVFKMIVEVLEKNETLHISTISKKSVINILHYLEIQTKIIDSSEIYNNQFLTSQNRVIDICKKEAATEYINLAGGMELYSSEEFFKNEIKLKFLEANLSSYFQPNTSFFSGLSIIDILMNNSVDHIKKQLEDYTIIQ